MFSFLRRIFLDDLTLHCLSFFLMGGCVFGWVLYGTLGTFQCNRGPEEDAFAAGIRRST